MPPDFANTVRRFATSNAEFAELVRQSLKELLGESAASAVLYHIGAEALQDPNLFEEKLRDIFGVGSSVIMEYLLKKMKRR